MAGSIIVPTFPVSSFQLLLLLMIFFFFFNEVPTSYISRKKPKKLIKGLLIFDSMALHCNGNSTF